MVSSRDPRLVERVDAVLKATGLTPQHLTLEVSENLALTNIETALPALFKLRESGVVLSMDDFGTGASSLQHIATLPLGSVKIDRSFVARLGQRCTESAIVQAIALIGTLLDREIVAEGVESADQVDHLIALGCHRGQGFFLSRPLKAQRASDLLNRPSGSWLVTANCQRASNMVPVKRVELPTFALRMRCSTN